MAAKSPPKKNSQSPLIRGAQPSLLSVVHNTHPQYVVASFVLPYFLHFHFMGDHTVDLIIALQLGKILLYEMYTLIFLYQTYWGMVYIPHPFKCTHSNCTIQWVRLNLPLCNYDHNEYTETFHYPQKFPRVSSQIIPTLLSLGNHWSAFSHYRLELCCVEFHISRMT